jgi:hypothetical protein
MRIHSLATPLAFAAAVFVSSAFFGPAANASSVVYTWSGNFNEGAFSASATLDVVAGEAISGVGTFTLGANTFDLTLITLTTDGGNGNYGGQTGFRDNHGTDIFGGDNVIPVDINGLIFAISNNPLRGQDALFTTWANGDGTSSDLISGTLQISAGPPVDAFNLYYEITVGSGSAAAPALTPLPATWFMLLSGCASLGLFTCRRANSKAAPLAAA